jgi:hypothetical protein
MGSVWVPSQDLQAVGTSYLVFSVLSKGDVHVDILCALSTYDVPSVGPTRSLLGDKNEGYDIMTQGLI